MGRRILITGLGTFWGGSVARALESDPTVDVIVGVDTAAPAVALERTEFVRADETFSILSRVVAATQVDTVVHTALVVDSTRTSDGHIHENNVIGTVNLLAALARADSPVTSLVVKSSTLVYGAAQRDPTWFAEDTPRTEPARTEVERSLLEAETQVNDFAEDNPGVAVAVLRFANVLGDGIVTPLSHALSLPLVPQILGFDPLMQFIDQEDVVRALTFAIGAEADADSRLPDEPVRPGGPGHPTGAGHPGGHGLAGVFNAAADDRLPWTEILAIAGKPPLFLPPVLTSAALEPLARLHLLDLPPEVLALLRYGRGVDNRRLKAAGFGYRYSTAGAVRHLIEARRVAGVVGAGRPAYRYEPDIEAFFRHSPAVVRQT